MSEEFDKILNDKLDYTSLNEIMPEFDKEEEWEKLSNRLPVKKRKILPLIGWTHAAALLVGLLISSLFFLSREDKSLIVTNTAPEEITTPTDVFINVPVDTVYITQAPAPASNTKNIQPVIRASNRSYSPMKTHPGAPSEKETQEPVIVQHTDTPTITNDTEPIAQKNNQKEKITVVHILDIDNEDRQSALNNYDPSQKQRTGFALQITTRRLPDENSEKPTSLVRSILKN